MNDPTTPELPAFDAWRQSFDPAPDSLSYLSEHLTLTAAVLFADLMLPDLVEVRGCVLRRAAYDPAVFDEWWATEKGQVAAIERVINHLHLWDVFEPTDAGEEAALSWLAGRIAESWQRHGASLFPDHRFVAEVTDEYGPTVTFSTLGALDGPAAGRL